MKEDRTWNGNYLVPEFPNLKLVPELIPQNMWGNAPREYIGWSAWNRLRKFVRIRAENKCEICGCSQSNSKLEVHERYVVRKEYLVINRLICVCVECHSCIHPGFAMARVKNQDKVYDWIVHRLADINMLPPEEMDRIVKLCFIRHRELDHVIKLDYSMLAEEPGMSKCITSLMRQQAMESKCLDAD